MIHERQFYQRGHRWGETTWSLRLDAEAGTIMVRRRKAMKSGTEICDMTPAAFAASGNWYEHRRFEARMKKLVGALLAEDKPSRLPFPASRTPS